MADKPLPSPELIRQLFSYDPVTGIMTHNRRDGALFHREKDMTRWNTCFAGKVAGSLGKHGYLTAGISNKQYYVHRLAWVIVHGEWPKTIDHINGNTIDNRIINLRSVEHKVNQRNLSIKSVSSGGAVGVYIEKGKFVARIGARENQKHLGRFSTFEDALAARQAAEKRLGYHDNHGRKSHVA